MITLISYADNHFKKAAIFQQITWASLGGKSFRRFTKEDINSNYAELHRDTLRMERGAGYWLWKPWIVLEALKALSKGDSIIYLDAGITLKKPILELQHKLDMEKITVFSGGKGNPLRKWIHPLVIRELSISEEVLGEDLVMAGAIHIPNNQTNATLISQWKDLCENPRLLRPDTLEVGFQEYLPDYVWHRHDTTLLSVLIQRQPDQFNVLDYTEFQSMFDLHRNPSPFFVIVSGRNRLMLRIRQILINFLPSSLRQILKSAKFKAVANRKKLTQEEVQNHKYYFRS